VALRVFARRGLGAARHAEIAGEAGVAVSTVFVYFPSRAELVSAVLGEVERFLLQMAERIHATRDPAPAVILAHARAFAGSVDAHPDLARVWLDWSTAVRDDVWPRYLELQEKVVGIFEETIRRGQAEGTISPAVDPEDDARLVVGSAHMIALMKFTHLSEERVDHFLGTLVQAAVGGAAKAS
jgi:TetR/AcrR family hemagglutinin/protease transcriptional regulator